MANTFRINHKKIEKIADQFTRTKQSYVEQLEESSEEVNKAIEQYNSVIEHHNQLVADMTDDLQGLVAQLQGMVDTLSDRFSSRSDSWRYSSEGSLVGDWLQEVVASRPKEVCGFYSLECDELEEVPDIAETVENHLNNVEINLLIDNCTEEPDTPDTPVSEEELMEQ